MRRHGRGALIAHAASTTPTLHEGHGERGHWPPLPSYALRRLDGIGTRQERVVVASWRHEHRVRRRRLRDPERRSLATRAALPSHTPGRSRVRYHCAVRRVRAARMALRRQAARHGRYRGPHLGPGDCGSLAAHPQRRRHAHRSQRGPRASQMLGPGPAGGAAAPPRSRKSARASHPYVSEDAV